MQNQIESSHKDFPFTIKNVNELVFNEIVKNFTGFSRGLVQIGSEEWLMPKTFEAYADKIYNFKARSDDVFICTYPRSGTTWSQEMIWLLCNDLDYETASKISINHRFPFLE